MGKGCRRRPLSVDADRFAERWERTFGPVVRGIESDGADRPCLQLFYTGHWEWDSGDVWREQMECQLPRGHDGLHGLDEERRGRFKE